MQLEAGVLAMPVWFLRALCLWPEGRGALGRLASSYLLPALNVTFVVGGLSSMLLDEYDHFMVPLSCVGDALAAFVCLAKVLCLSRNGPKVRELYTVGYRRVYRTRRGQKCRLRNLSYSAAIPQAQGHRP